MDLPIAQLSVRCSRSSNVCLHFGGGGGGSMFPRYQQNCPCVPVFPKSILSIWCSLFPKISQTQLLFPCSQLYFPFPPLFPKIFWPCSFVPWNSWWSLIARPTNTWLFFFFLDAFTSSPGPVIDRRFEFQFNSHFPYASSTQDSLRHGIMQTERCVSPCVRVTGNGGETVWLTASKSKDIKWTV